ncbi:MAG TPA: formate dehydrogenase accessory protein FdhE [Firmicutes bacterium]|nr:formate dehydrogenase accessory protein FdhE [Bacillota bacterium]
MLCYPPGQALLEGAQGRYEKEKPSLKPLITFYLQVYKKQKEMMTEIAPVMTRPEALQREQKTEEPILQNKTLLISAEAVEKMLRAVTAAFRECFPSVSSGNGNLADKIVLPALSAIQDSLTAEMLGRAEQVTLARLQQLLSRLHAGGPAEEKLYAASAQLLRLAVQPYYVQYAAQLPDAGRFAHWDRGVCPVCGDAPLLAVLRDEDGKKMLECSLCHWQWPVTRLLCPACGCSNHEALAFFYNPREKYRRVYVCNDCHTYLKTTVLRESPGPVIADMENAATLTLDLLAQREGYRALCPELQATLITGEVK